MTSTALACTVKNYLRVVENLTADLRNNINLNELRNIAYKTACDHGLHDKELLRK